MLNYIPWATMYLKTFFYWIEVKKQTLFFDVMQLFVFFRFFLWMKLTDAAMFLHNRA